MTTEEYSFKQINTVVLALSCATNSEPAKKYRRLVRAATGPLLDMQNRADGSDKRTGHHADTSAAGRQQQRSRKQTRTVRSGLVRTHAQGGGQVRVSSSYIARICTLLNMPRPERGYWAKLAVGKAPKQPVLPEPRYGDPLEWVRDGAPPKRARVLPRPQERQPGRKHIARPQLPDRHPLISRARPLFDVERLSYYGGYLKRTKKLLVDLAVTKTGLDKALAFANEFFLSLEARNHRVEIAPHSELFHRAQIEERENPGKGHHHNDLWSPIRCTVTYIGTVAIGLTVIEMSEEAEARYVNGEYVRVIDYIPKRRGRYAEDRVWTSTRAFPTGRLCLQAYSPYPRAAWSQQCACNAGPEPLRPYPGHHARTGEGHGQDRTARRRGRAPSRGGTPRVGGSERAVAPPRGGSTSREAAEGRQRGTA